MKIRSKISNWKYKFLISSIHLKIQFLLRILFGSPFSLKSTRKIDQCIKRIINESVVIEYDVLSIKGFLSNGDMFEIWNMTKWNTWAYKGSVGGVSWDGLGLGHYKISTFSVDSPKELFSVPSIKLKMELKNFLESCKVPILLIGTTGIVDLKDYRRNKAIEEIIN